MKSLTFLYLLTCHVSFSQEPTVVLGKLQKHVIQFDRLPPVTIVLPFSSIRVVDKRFDTSKFGFMNVKVQNKKVVTKGSFRSAMEAALNNVMPAPSNKTNQTLWVFVRHYWLQETTTAEMENNKLEQSNNLDKITTCKATIECFLQSDSRFTPVLRMDTVFTKLQSNGEFLKEMANEPLKHLLKSLSSINWNKGRKEMTYSEVQEFEDRFYKFPRFANDVRTKGIYKTFRDFLNNQPWETEFEVVRNSKTDELYLVNKGERKILTEFWGFSDGGIIYINIGLNFFKLVRVNNSYETYGARGLVQHTTIAGRPHTSEKSLLYKGFFGGPLVTRDRSKLTLKPLHINMETGDLY